MALFLPPQGVRDITRIEIILNIDHSNPEAHLDYHTHLESIPNTFPHVTDFSIAFYCPLLRPIWLKKQPDSREAIENILLLPLDEMVRKLESRCRVTVAFPTNFWIPMMGRARRRDPDSIIVESQPPLSRARGNGDRFWRAMLARVEGHSCDDEEKDKCNKTRGFPAGYWLQNGNWVELPRSAHCFIR